MLRWGARKGTDICLNAKKGNLTCHMCNCNWLNLNLERCAWFFISLGVVVFPSVCRKSFCSRIISPVLSDVRHMPSRNTIIGHFSCRKIQKGFKHKETIKTKIKQYITQKSRNAGGQIASATAAATFKIRSIFFGKMYSPPPIFLAKCIFYTYPLPGEKNSGSKLYLVPPK